MTPANGLNVTWRFGDPTGTADFALTSGLTTDLDPWWEISADPTFETTDYAQTLSGAMPAPTGTLTRLLSTSRLTDGAMPAPMGVLTYVGPGGEERTLTGAMPAATGTLTRLLSAFRSVAGSMPAAAGGLTRALAALRSNAGAMPAPSGTLTRLLSVTRSVAGAMPSPAGMLIAVGPGGGATGSRSGLSLSLSGRLGIY